MSSALSSTPDAPAARVIVAGGGMAGVAAARRLERLTGPEVEIVVINPTNAMVYPPLLPEVAGGTIEPRHAVSSLRAGLDRAELVLGELCALAPTAAERTVGLDGDGDGNGNGSGNRISNGTGPGRAGVATVKLPDGSKRELAYDHLVVAFGAVSRLFPVPGLVDVALGFTTLTEARYARERVIERLEFAASTEDAEARRRALTFVVVGGGYTGVEVVAELEELSRSVTADIAEGTGTKARWCIVEATDTLLAMVRPSLADLTAETLRGRGVELYMETSVAEVDGSVISLSDGTTIEADTLWWCAGVVGHPALAALGLPTDDKGRVEVDATGAVKGCPGLWAAGDGAAFPDVVGGGLCPPSAQYAVRQGKKVAENVVRELNARRPLPFRYRSKGELLTVGRGRGVGEVYGRAVTGRGAWHLRFAYHLVTIPTWRRKLRLWVDWTANLWFPAETVMFGDQSPRDPLLHAARTQDMDEV